jgi:hypothetical protein
MVINLIIDHGKVHQQIFIINNKDKCVQIPIPKQKFAITVKRFSSTLFLLLSLFAIIDLFHVFFFNTYIYIYIYLQFLRR